jgi:hypothetical protein
MAGMVALFPVLPVPIQFIIAMVAYAINERMAHRLEYVQEEVRVLREALAAATGKTGIAFTPEQRRRLAQGQGPHTPGTGGVLPNRSSEHHPGVVSTAGSPEVRWVRATPKTG